MERKTVVNSSFKNFPVPNALHGRAFVRQGHSFVRGGKRSRACLVDRICEIRRLAEIFLRVVYLNGMKACLPYHLVAFLTLFAAGCFAQSPEKDTTPASVEVPEGMAPAVVGAGCFWCVEVFYEKIDGVHEAVSGGEIPNPSYQQVARGVLNPKLEKLGLEWSPTCPP